MLATNRRSAVTPGHHIPNGEANAALGAELRFPLGIPGFIGAERFQLEAIAQSGGAFQILRCLDLDDVRLVVTPLETIQTTVAPEHLDEVRRDLEIPADALLVLGVVTLAKVGDRIDAFVNLKAPLFIDCDQRLGVQYFLTSADYPMRQPLPAA